MSIKALNNAIKDTDPKKPKSCPTGYVMGKNGKCVKVKASTRKDARKYLKNKDSNVF